MSRRLRRVVQAALTTPWALMPERLEALAEVIAYQIEFGKLSRDEIRAAAGPQRPVAAPTTGGVAVLPLFGIIGHRMNQVQDISGPGGTSTEKFALWFRQAMEDDAVSAVILDIDSPGGAVSGVPELAKTVFDARGTKPILAVANSLAASAAYWIGTAADELVVTPSGDVGSVGVFAIHTETSRADDAEGVTHTLIRAGRFKAEANSLEPLGDEARMHMQERVDEAHRAFVKALARQRDVTVDQVREQFGEGRVFGAERVVRMGMADRVATLEETIGRVMTRRSGPRSGVRVAQASLGMAAVALPSLSLITISGGGSVTAAGTVPPAAVVDAEPRIVPSHEHEPAPEAKEHTMPEDNGTAARTTGADPITKDTGDHAGPSAALEQARVDGLAALAEEYSRPAAELRQWMTSKVSVEQAQRQILGELRVERDTIRVHALPGGDNGTAHGPYRTLGEQLLDIAQAGMTGRVPERLTRIQGAATGGSATSGPDGGFLIQKEFSVDLAKEAFDEGALSSRCDVSEIGANADGLEVVMLDETSRATGSRWGGVQVFRRAEAETVTATKPQIKPWELRLEDLMGIAWAADRLLKDAASMEAVFGQAFRSEMAFTVDNEIYRGTGAGQCLGILNAPATVEVPKESGQAADTVVAENVTKMWGRVPPRSRARGVWFYNVEVEQQLERMFFPVKNVAGTENVGGWPVFTPAGALAANSLATIKGRPAIPLEYCSALGDKGDIAFLDLSRYKLISKGGVDEEQSIHVRFLQAERVFRWMFRVNGAPKESAPLTPFKGTATLSPFVVLANRA